MQDKKIIFMGTPIFAAHILEELIKADYNVGLVVTQPDKKVGRKQELKPTPVKEVAMANNIEVFQPTRIREDFSPIVEYGADLIITAAYGQIVPDEVLNAPKYECINVHGSLLPKYRGGAPIHYSVLNGDDKTGVTIMQMVSKMDAGDMIYQTEMPITEQDNVGTVHDEMMKVGAKALLKTIPTIFDGTYTKTPQNEAEVTYAWNIKPEEEILDFTKDVNQVYNHIRGLNPWPVAYFMKDSKRYKVFTSTKTVVEHNYKAGEVVSIDANGLQIACQNGIINISEFQPAGKRKMTVKDYVNGKVEFSKGDICE